MALTGIQILKMLPKKNCGECSIPTCLAFAMKVAAGQTEIGECPYVDDEVKATIGEASAPPIRTIKLGSADLPFTIGGETCLFRHEKRFENPTGIAVLVTTAMAAADVDGRIERFNTLRYERVGVNLRADLIAVQDSKGDAKAFCDLVGKVLAGAADAQLILMTGDAAAMKTAAGLCGARKPLLFGAAADNAEAMAAVAKEAGCPLGVKGATVDDTVALTEKLLAAGLKDMVIDTGARTVRAALEDNVLARRAAVRSKFKPLGFPTITFPCEMTDDSLLEAMIASVLVAKYAGIVVLSDLQGDILFPLLLERLNIFTDPQRPMVVAEDIYSINGPARTRRCLSPATSRSPTSSSPARSRAPRCPPGCSSRTPRGFPCSPPGRPVSLALTLLPSLSRSRVSRTRSSIANSSFLAISPRSRVNWRRNSPTGASSWGRARPGICRPS